MNNLLKEVLRNLQTPPKFQCSVEGKLNRRKFEFTHQMGRGLKANEFLKWMPPSMKELFQCLNGANLFRPTETADAGFVFFDVEEIAQEIIDLQDLFQDHMEDDECDEDCSKWLAGLIPIGAPFCSGDRYVIDTVNRRSDGECPILFLDHELTYGGLPLPSDTDEIASSYIDFFCEVLSNPLKYMTRGWVDEATGENWYVKSIDAGVKASVIQAVKVEPLSTLKMKGELNFKRENLTFETVEVTLADLTKQAQEFALTDQVRFLIAPLMEEQLRIVRVIAPKDLLFCDVSIYWPWITSMVVWCRNVSSNNKKIIRREQKAAGWKSDFIYHDGPSFALYGRYIDFCVCSEDVNVPINYVKSQIESLPQPFKTNDIWEFEYDHIHGTEGELAKLVGNFEPYADTEKLEQLASVCRDLENAISHPIQDTRVRSGLIGIYSLGPDYATNEIYPRHVWRAHLLRLLGWPDAIVIARAALYKIADAEVLGNDGKPMSWRGELQAFIDETISKYPMIDWSYKPSKEFL